MDVRWPSFRCGRFVLFSVPTVALLGALTWFILVNRPLATVDPQELFARAQTKGAKSYTYRLRTELVTPRGTCCLSDLHGVRVLPDRVSVRGKIFNAPVEIVQVGGATYIKDSFSERWLTLEGERLGEAGFFTTELDPLILLDFTTPPVIKS
ncbi:hypothetical protein [Thermodesulfitimonas sp.]